MAVLDHTSNTEVGISMPVETHSRDTVAIALELSTGSSGEISENKAPDSE